MVCAFFFAPRCVVLHCAFAFNGSKVPVCRQTPICKNPQTLHFSLFIWNATRFIVICWLFAFPPVAVQKGSIVLPPQNPFSNRSSENFRRERKGKINKKRKETVRAVRRYTVQQRRLYFYI